MYGKKNTEERALLLQGMEILVSRVGQLVSGAAPQVSASDKSTRLSSIAKNCRFPDHDYTPNIIQRPRDPFASSSTLEKVPTDIKNRRSQAFDCTDNRSFHPSLARTITKRESSR